MKKILLLVSLIMFGTSLMAAYQYDTQGNQSWLTFDSSTTLSFSLSRSGKDNEHTNFIDKGNGIADYGWYNLTTGESGSFANGASATFNENDKIALWVKDSEGNVYNSTKEPSEFIWGKSNIDGDILKLYGGNKGSNGTHEYYVFQVNTVNTNNKAPSGQPLPGIIATLVVGGGTLVYLKKRKKLNADK